MLSQVEQAEQVLRQLGIRQVRVRHHDSIARIEVEPQDFSACHGTPGNDPDLPYKR